MLDTMLIGGRQQLRPAGNQSIKHMQAWKLKNQRVGRPVGGKRDALSASHFSIGQSSRSGLRSVTSFPLSRK